MQILSNVFVVIVIALQTYFMIMEMFLWQTPKVMRSFGFTPEFAASTAALAKNQGLYNGFLAAGLLWGLFNSDASFAFQIKFFFFNCVLIAGLYGAITASRKILYVQALPALLGIFFLMFA